MKVLFKLKFIIKKEGEKGDGCYLWYNTNLGIDVYVY